MEGVVIAARIYQLEPRSCLKAVGILVGMMELGEMPIARLDDSLVSVPVNLKDGIVVGRHVTFG